MSGQNWNIAGPGQQGEWSDMQAHEAAMGLPIVSIVKYLVDLLGAPTVAVIGGVSETRAVAQWMKDREPQRPHVLRFAYQLAMMVRSVSDDNVVRAWFRGSNPHLDDQVPVLMLRDGSLEEVQRPLMAAARAFALRE